MPHTISAVAFLFHRDFTANKFVGWRASNEGITCELYATFRANTGLCREIFNNAFFKTLDESTFTTFPILEKLCLTFCAENLNRLSRLFLVWFSHSDSTLYFLSLGATRTKLIPSKMTVEEITNCIVTGSDKSKTPPSVAITGTESCAMDATTVFSFLTT